MKQVINTTHIDTGGHGYYSVSKKDISLLGIADKISGYSGHNFDRVYLEEDCDAALLYDRAKEMGIEINRKEGYNLKFNITHNYLPELFNWKPQPGQVVIISGTGYTIAEVTKNKLIVTDAAGKRFRVTTSNPFKYIDKVLN